MYNFLWRKVSKEEEESIKKEAKQIMDEFAKSLESAEEIKEGFEVKRENQLRDETRAECSKEFRKILFENAPSKSGDFIRAEKKKWE